MVKLKYITQLVRGEKGDLIDTTSGSGGRVAAKHGRGVSKAQLRAGLDSTTNGFAEPSDSRQGSRKTSSEEVVSPGWGEKRGGRREEGFTREHRSSCGVRERSRGAREGRFNSERY